MSSNFKTLAVLICSLLLAAALGTSQLTRDAFWYDEILSYYFLGAGQFGPFLPLQAFLERLILLDRWPPLYYASLGGWSSLAGWNAFSGRVLSLFYGLLAIAVTYRLTANTAGSRTGIIATVLLSTSAFFVYYLHEMRGYTLYTLTVLLCLLAYWRALHHLTRRHALMFVLATTLALYSHFANYPMVAALGLYHLLFGLRQRNGPRLLVLFAISAFLALPWLLVTYYKLQQGQTIGQTSPGLPLIAFFPSFGNGFWPLLPVMMAGAVWAVNWRRVQLVAVVAIFTMAITLVLNIIAPFLFHMRHLIGVLPLVLILAAFGLDAVLRRAPRLAASMLALWVGLGIWYSFDFRHMLSTPGHEPTLPMSVVQTLTDVGAACIHEEAAVILHLGQPVVRDMAWEWINDVVMVYYWQHMPYRYAHISTLDPITNDDPYGEDPQTQVRNLWRYQTKAARYIGEAQQVWLFELKDLPPIRQTALLKATLTELGYTTETTVIDTPHLTGRVFSPSQPDIACDPLHSPAGS